MKLDDFLKMESPERAAQVIVDLKDQVKMRNRAIFRNYKKIVNSPEWKAQITLERQLAWDERTNKNRAYHKFCTVPEVLYYSDTAYWKKAINDRAYMRKYHPELVI